MRKIGFMGVLAAFGLLVASASEASAFGKRGGCGRGGHSSGCGGGSYATASCGTSAGWGGIAQQSGGCSDCAGFSTGYGGQIGTGQIIAVNGIPIQQWNQQQFAYGQQFQQPQQFGYQQPGVIIQGNQQPGTVTTTGPADLMPQPNQQQFGQKGTLWITGDDGKLKMVPADYYEKLNLKRPNQP